MFASDDSCLKIATMGTCLLCLDPENPNDFNDVSTRSYTNHGFSQFLRYLKISNKDLLSHPSFTFKPLEMDHEANVEVSLCSSCVNVTDEFERLYASYELIKLQIDDCVISIHQSIRSGNDSLEKSEQFQAQMKPQCFSDMINYSVVSNLRSLTLEKCLRELQVYDLPPNENQIDVKVKEEMMISSYSEPRSFKTSSATDDTSDSSDDDEEDEDSNSDHMHVQLPKVTSAKSRVKANSKKYVKNRKNNKMQYTKPQKVANTKQNKIQQNNYDKKQPNYFGKKQQKRFEQKEEKKVFGKRQPMRHVKKEENTKKPSKRFECRTCHRVFSMKINLVRHSKTHKKENLRKKQSSPKHFRQSGLNGKKSDISSDGKQLHLCELCGKAFANIHNVKVHLRTHTGDKPFKCNRCSMSFAQKAHLEKHSRSPDKSKLFKCNKCSLKFCLRLNFNKHQLKNHPEKNF